MKVKERGRFLKKAAQKLLLCRATGVVPDTAHDPALTKFFCYFLFTKSSLPFYTLLALTACAPPLPKPDTAVKVHGYLPGQSVPTGALPTAWWTIFGNRSLNALEQEGLAASPTLAQAEQNLLAADQNEAAANGVFLPQVTLNPPGYPAFSRQSYPTGPNGFPPFTVFGLAGQVSYDPGLFGARKYTWANGAALVAYQAAELAAARQSVAGNIAAASITEAGARAQIATTERIIAAEQKLLTLLQGEYADGAIPLLNVLQQQSVIQATEATLPALQTTADEQRDRLAVLTGTMPADFSPAAIGLDELAVPENIQVAVPSRYLEDRPDLRAALAQVAAQHAALGIAVAHLYPDFSLSATGGYVAETASTLFNTSSAFWTLAGNLLAPIYEGGELHARKKQAQAQLEAALAAYRQTALAAFAQAADALQAVHNGAEAMTRAEEADHTADQAYQLAAAQFRLGAVDYTTVLNAQATAAQQALYLVQARTHLLLAVATLQAVMAK